MKLAHDAILYLSRADVESIALPMPEMINALDGMFKEKGEGRVEMPPKPGIHTRQDAFIHAMPAFIPSQNAAGMKWISGYPENHKKKLPYINGLLILNDPETGIPLTIMDATWITAWRTGAATAVAAKYLARKDSSSLGIIACGVQGRSNLEALVCLFPVRRVKAYDVNRQAAEQFALEMASKTDTDIVVVNSPREAVADCDLIVTSGPIYKEPDPVIKPGWQAEGSFACLVDFDSYWQGPALEQADILVTDDYVQMEYYRSEGYFKDTPSCIDLGDIVAGKMPGRSSESQRTACINLGLALDDMAVAILIFKTAIERGIGTKLPL